MGCRSSLSTAGVAGEVLADGREGFLVAPGDAGAIATIFRRPNDDAQPAGGDGHGRGACDESLPTWAESAARIRGFRRACGLPG